MKVSFTRGPSRRLTGDHTKLVSFKVLVIGNIVIPSFSDDIGPAEIYEEGFNVVQYEVIWSNASYKDSETAHGIVLQLSFDEGGV